MDFSKIKVIIEENRALTEMSSLPFVINKNEKNIAWFNYTVEPMEMGMAGKIRKLFVLNADMDLQTIDGSSSMKLSAEEFQEPLMTEEQYFAELTTRFDVLDEKGNLELLKNSVLTAFIPIYEVAIQKLGGK